VLELIDSIIPITLCYYVKFVISSLVFISNFRILVREQPYGTTE